MLARSVEARSFVIPIRAVERNLLPLVWSALVVFFASMNSVGTLEGAWKYRYLASVSRPGRLSAIIKPCPLSRRGGRVAEGGGLLNRYRVKSSIGGSNPPLSARRFFRVTYLRI